MLLTELFLFRSSNIPVNVQKAFEDLERVGNDLEKKNDDHDHFIFDSRKKSNEL